jgi:hypothetical protein
MRHILLASLLAAAMFITVSGTPVQAGPDKIVICHRPPGHEPSEQTMAVSFSAAAAHRAQHNDCVLLDPPEDCPCHDFRFPR